MKLPENVLEQYPSGRWGFVGSVRADLAICRVDGSPASEDEIAQAKQFGLGFCSGLTTRSFATEADAIAARDM